MTEKRILLIIGGGIAAYKSCELIRLLRKQGLAVRCVLTAGGAHFVTPMTLQALSEDKVYTHLFDLTDESEMGHIELSRSADLLVVCPATADLMAKMASGLADDLASTLLLATDTPVLAVPAMNVRMWEHAATRRNVAQLKADGISVMQPATGDMACGEFGEGRLPEPEAIAGEILRLLETRSPELVEGCRSASRASTGSALWSLAGKHVLVTAGPTHEAIDPVRYIANRSSGKQGFAIAAAAAEAGARVTLIAGPVNVPTPAGVTRIDVESAREMLDATLAALPADIAIMTAAVADWRAEASAQKIKKDGSGRIPPLALAENPDILATIAKGEPRPKIVIGFAAETQNLLAHAEDKLKRKGCDWIVANDVSGPKETSVMGGDRNRVHILKREGIESWDEMSKQQVAHRLIDEIAAALAEKA